MLTIGSGDRTGFCYWRDPGAFAEYKVCGDVGKFVGVWSTMIQAYETLLGVDGAMPFANHLQSLRLRRHRAGRWDCGRSEEPAHRHAQGCQDGLLPNCVFLHRIGLLSGRGGSVRQS